MKIQDDFDKMRRAIERVGDRERANRLLSTTGQTIVANFMAKLEETQPDGSQTYVGERPSVRRGYTPIASGWQPVDIEDTDRGISLSLKSTSQHVNIQRFGTRRKNYPIPNFPTGVYFWWGAPLPWSPSRIPEYVARAPGMFWFPQITHPGIEPHGGEDFVRRAWMAIRAYANRQFRGAADTILFQPFREMK